MGDEARGPFGGVEVGAATCKTGGGWQGPALARDCDCSCLLGVCVTCACPPALRLGAWVRPAAPACLPVFVCAGSCSSLARLALSCPALLRLDLRGCGSLERMKLAGCPRLAALDATFCGGLVDEGEGGGSGLLQVGGGGRDGTVGRAGVEWGGGRTGRGPKGWREVLLPVLMCPLVCAAERGG